MNIERAAMHGQLAMAEQQQTSLEIRIESAARAIRQGLNMSLCEVDDLEIPQLDEQWDVLKSAWGEYIGMGEKIRRLKRELS